MMNIAIIGTVGVPACYGGFESLVENLLSYTPANVEYTVFCSAKNYKKQEETYKGAKLKYINLNANGASSVIYDFISMIKSLKFDVMLILGVSGCAFLPLIRKIYKGRIVTNIDGLEWRRDKWSKLAKKFLHFSEKMAVKYSDEIIGDNKGITDYVKDEYNKKATLIAYGGDQAKKVVDKELYSKYPFCRKPYAVTVCRIEPENNVHWILEAYSRLPEESLVFVGNWNASPYGQNLKRAYSIFPNIHILDPIYDSHVINWIRSNASVYVHGHSAGGTNPSLVEAMNLGLPVLAYDCVYNRETTKNQCRYWKYAIDIEDIINSNMDLSKIGPKMKEIASKEYTWEVISKKYNSILSYNGNDKLLVDKIGNTKFAISTSTNYSQEKTK